MVIKEELYQGKKVRVLTPKDMNITVAKKALQLLTNFETYKPLKDEYTVGAYTIKTMVDGAKVVIYLMRNNKPLGNIQEDVKKNRVDFELFRIEDNYDARAVLGLIDAVQLPNSYKDFVYVPKTTFSALRKF